MADIKVQVVKDPIAGKRMVQLLIDEATAIHLETASADEIGVGLIKAAAIANAQDQAEKEGRIVKPSGLVLPRAD